MDDKKKVDQPLIVLSVVEGSFLFETDFSGVCAFVVGFVFVCFKPPFSELLHVPSTWLINILSRPSHFILITTIR